MNGIALNNRSKTASACRRNPHRAVRLPLKALALATLCALHALPSASYAQSIGALEVRSRLGETFFAAVPVQTPDGLLDPRCIRVKPNPNAPEGAAALQGVRVRIGSADTVLIETSGTVMGPVVGLRLEVGCGESVARDFVVLDEPPSLSERPSVAGVDLAPPARAAAKPGSAAARTAAVPAVRAQQAPRRAPVASVGAPAPRDLVQSAPPLAPGHGSATIQARWTSNADNTRRVAELRARSDDHAAALLALDDRLALLQKQAEVLKLQLEQRLGVVSAGGVEQPAATPAATAGASTVPPSAASGNASAATAASAPNVPAAAGEAISAASADGSSATTTEAAAATISPSAIVSSVAASPLTGRQHAPSQRNALDLLSDWKVAGGLAALLLGAFAFKLRRRPTFKSPTAAAAAPAWEIGAEDLIREHARTQPVPALKDADGHSNDGLFFFAGSKAAVDQTAEWIAPPTTDSLPVPSALEAPAVLPGAAMTREFHIAQKFQPDEETLVARASAEEIVQQARTHYMEDGDLFKAIDLLEMAIAARKDSVRPWQALFAIYRREKMHERFQRLANVYRKTFGTDDSWSAVLALGREFDPANTLYAVEGQSASLPEDLVERWLGVPLDFTAHLLADEMHEQLMDTYSVQQQRKRPISE